MTWSSLETPSQTHPWVCVLPVHTVFHPINSITWICSHTKEWGASLPLIIFFPSCVTKLLERHNTHVYSTQIGIPQQIKVWIPLKSNWLNQWVLSGLLTGVWWGVPHRIINDSKIAVSLRPTPVWMTTHKYWEIWAHCTAYRQLNRLECPFQV